MTYAPSQRFARRGGGGGGGGYNFPDATVKSRGFAQYSHPEAL